MLTPRLLAMVWRNQHVHVVVVSQNSSLVIITVSFFFFKIIDSHLGVVETSKTKRLAESIYQCILVSIVYFIFVDFI